MPGSGGPGGRVGLGRPWLIVTGLTVVAATLAVTVAWLVEGFRWGRLWVVVVGVVLLAALERYPVAVSPGRSGRRYQDVTELGVGVLLWRTSPTALGVLVALAYVPLLMRRELSVWKRVFGVGQVVLAAVAAGAVYGAFDAESRGWAVAATGVTVTAALTVPLVAMARALREEVMVVEALRSLPTALAMATASLAAGLILARAMDTPGLELLGILGAVGAAALVRASHEASMRADRMHVLFKAATQLQSPAGGSGLSDLLRQLGPLVVPGAEHLELARTRPAGGDAVPVGERGWLTVVRGGPANRSTKEDRKRLELLAGLIDESARRTDEMIVATEAAATDPMTGLLNRRGLEHAIAQISEPSTIVMVDLDSLKQINDQHGHPAGDAAITALADALRAGVRAGDLVARVGGDEFVVVIVGQPPEQVRPIIDRLAATANDDPNLPTGVRVRASLGAAHWAPDGDTSWTEAAARADANLYASRANRGIPSRHTT